MVYNGGLLVQLLILLSLAAGLFYLWWRVTKTPATVSGSDHYNSGDVTVRNR